jgi:hypothetical protein
MWHVWERLEVHMDFGVTLEGKLLLEITGRRWEDIIKIYLQEVEWGHRLD